MANITCYYGDEANVTVVCDGVHFSETELIEASDWQFWVYLILYCLLVCFAGLMSGLTMGLLSLDVMSLEVLKRGGKPKEQKYARRILFIVKRHHLLLVTLLLANAAAVETMPVFLGKITHEVVAIIVSITAVLLFGEIIPQAVCTRFGLAIGYYCSPVVLLLMAILFPITFPIAMLLDCILGKNHGTFFRRAELRELVSIHASKEQTNEEPLSYDEVLILKSALEMRDKTVEDAMTPLESVFMIDINAVIDLPTMSELLARGHSRVPVFKDSPDNVCGLLLVKTLIYLDPDKCAPVKVLQGSQIPPPSCLTTTPLYDILNKFQTGRSHLSLVYREETENSEPVLVGIITLEDVMEELIGEEIIDETDVYIDVHRRIAVAKAKLRFHHQSISAPSGTVRPPRSKRGLNRSQSQPYVRTNSAEKAAPVSHHTEEISGLEHPQVLSTSAPNHSKLEDIPESMGNSPTLSTADLDNSALDEDDDNAPLIMKIN